MTSRRLAHILQSRGILGVCFAPFPDVVPQFTFAWDRFCTAAIGYTMLRPALHRASPHQFQGMQLTLNTLRLRGYKHIGVALGKRVSKIVAKNWIAAVLLFQYNHGRSAATCLVYEESDRQELTHWLKTGKPDAMIVSDVFLIEWIKEMGIRIPEDMGVVPLERHPGYAGLDQKPARSRAFFAGVARCRPRSGASAAAHLRRRTKHVSTGHARGRFRAPPVRDPPHSCRLPDDVRRVPPRVRHDDVH